MLKYFAILGTVVLTTAEAASAQIPCMKTELAVTELTGPHYSEQPLFQGTIPSGQTTLAVTAFANASTGTWTIVISPDGQNSCLILSGKDFAPATATKVIGRLSSSD